MVHLKVDIGAAEILESLAMSALQSKCFDYRVAKKLLQINISSQQFQGRMALLVTLFLVLVNIFNAITTNSPKADGLNALQVKAEKSTVQDLLI